MIDEPQVDRRPGPRDAALSDAVAYASQSTVTDPGDLASRLDIVPPDLPSLQRAARQLVFHYRADGDFAENAVWFYEDPLPGAEMIRERLAFYQDKVEVYEVSDASVNPRAHTEDIDEVVRHTDAGDGHSQAAPWPANVEQPRSGI